MTPTSIIALAVVALAAGAHGAAVKPGRTINPMVWPMGGGFSEVSPYIIGGTAAAEGEFPHQVSMQVSVFWMLESHICGGTIIADKWILTAAHCVKGVPWYASAFILAGKNNLGKNEAGQQRVDVKKMYTHESYGDGVGPNDIGLLELKSALKFSDRIKAAKLPASDEITDGWATLTGWGSVSTTENVVIPDKLQKVNLPIILWKECNAWIQASSDYYNEPNPLAESNICVGYLETAGQGACSGDSGGPLVQKDSAGDYVVIGATSWGYFPCQSQPAPSVYTRVSAFVDWINKKMGK